jgi:hypothetical protein
MDRVRALLLALLIAFALHLASPAMSVWTGSATGTPTAYAQGDDDQGQDGDDQGEDEQ